MGEPLADVIGRVHDLHGAPLAPSVAVLSSVACSCHGDGRPVQGVQFLPQLLRVELDGEHVVRQEFLADEPGVGPDGVAGVGGDDVPGQAVVLVQAAQQRRELRDLVRLRADGARRARSRRRA